MGGRGEVALAPHKAQSSTSKIPLGLGFSRLRRGSSKADHIKNEGCEAYWGYRITRVIKVIMVVWFYN